MKNKEEIEIVGWVPVEECQLNAEERVYVVCEIPKNGGGVIRLQTIAEYIPYMTVREVDYMAEEFQGIGNYNEEEDDYYVPEGFYEWQIETDTYWKISYKITHCMKLMELP